MPNLPFDEDLQEFLSASFNLDEGCDNLSSETASLAIALKLKGRKLMTQQQPTVTPKLEEPKFGFSEYAERLNGRAAMIRFALTLIIEYVTGQGLLEWLGLG